MYPFKKDFELKPLKQNKKQLIRGPMISAIEDSKSQDKPKINEKQQALHKTKVQCRYIFFLKSLLTSQDSIRLKLYKTN